MENRKKHRKGQVAPEGSDALVGKDNNAYRMDEMGDYLANNTTLSASSKMFQDAVKTVVNSPNAFKVIVNARANAGRWKAYACSRRVRRRPIAEAGQDSDELRQLSSGLGLDDIDSAYVKPYKEDVDGKRPPEKNLSVAANQALLQYFAKLGQTNNDDETLDLTFIKSLIDSGASINCTDKYGQTVLHEVARAWHRDVAKFLLENGADINKGDKFGRTPLHVSAAVDYPEMVDLLISHGADKEAKTIAEKQTPVFYAAKTDAVQSLKTLITKHNCEYKTITDYKGRTPIHVAAELDRSETARLLLELEAPTYISDNEGARAITWMINKMAPVANEALNQFHMTDRPNRKQYFYLSYLVRDKAKDPDGKSQTPLHVAVNFRQFDLLMHPVFIRLLDVMWQKFGRFWALVQLAINLVYICLWTVIGIAVEYDKRHIYRWPEDTWRIFLYLFAVGFTGYLIWEEINEFLRSRRVHAEWEEKRKADIEKDKRFCHPRWPEEMKYLNIEIKEVEKQSPKYFKDKWNIFDWGCYILLLVCMATHIADIISHTEALARAHIRLMAVTIIFLWLRLMKFGRAFALLGPFIVMLGHMLTDCLRFIFLYMEFYIPYLAAFWMIFGGTKRAEDNYDEEITVSGYLYPGQLFFSNLRLTLVDDYDYDNMNRIDSVMSDLLLASWFMLSSILCLNLFIALLSDTFQRVYDNAQANSVMQKAITILNIWDGSSKAQQQKFLDYIDMACSPLKDEYDDDLTQSGEEDIKKVTHQIKEDLDNFQEMFKLHFGDPRSHLLSGMDNGGGGGGGGGGGQGSRGLVSVDKFETEVDDLRESLKSVKLQQDEMASKLRKDMNSVKSMLRQLLGKDGIEPSDFADAPPPSYTSSEQTPLSRMKRKKKKGRPTSAGLEIGTLEEGSTESSMLDSQPIFDISEFSPASFPDLTRSVQPQVFDVMLSPTSSSQRQQQQQQQPGTDDGNSTNC